MTPNAPVLRRARLWIGGVRITGFSSEPVARLGKELSSRTQGWTQTPHNEKELDGLDETEPGREGPKNLHNRTG